MPLPPIVESSPEKKHALKSRRRSYGVNVPINERVPDHSEAQAMKSDCSTSKSNLFTEQTRVRIKLQASKAARSSTFPGNPILESAPPLCSRSRRYSGSYSEETVSACLGKAQKRRVSFCFEPEPAAIENIKLDAKNPISYPLDSQTSLKKSTSVSKETPKVSHRRESLKVSRRQSIGNSSRRNTTRQSIVGRRQSIAQSSAAGTRKERTVGQPKPLRQSIRIDRRQSIAPAQRRKSIADAKCNGPSARRQSIIGGSRDSLLTSESKCHSQSVAVPDDLPSYARPTLSSLKRVRDNP